MTQPGPHDPAGVSGRGGPHDLGGRSGFGPIAPEPATAPPFHAEWERRALGLTLCAAALGCWNIDESRHARESLPADVYLSASYFEIWLRALEALLLRHGLIAAPPATPDAGLPGAPPVASAAGPGRAASAAPQAAAPAVPAPHPRRLAARDVAATLARGTPYDRPLSGPARFRPGDRVRATGRAASRGHTRLPGYARGRVGRILSDHGGFVLPDTHAHGQGEAPERLYTVLFDGATLWGAEAPPGLEICIDAWESYLEPA